MKSFQLLLLTLLVTPAALNAGGGNPRYEEPKNVTVRFQSQPDRPSLITVIPNEDDEITDEAPSTIINSQLQETERREITLGECVVVKAARASKTKTN